MQFFDLKRPAKLGLSIPEQKHRWLREFLKAFMVVFCDNPFVVVR